MDDFFPEALFVIVPLWLALWVVMAFVLSKVSGWATLAAYYGTDKDFHGPTWRFQSGRLRLGVHYGLCLTIGANSEGLYLSILRPFRVGHPPLLVPWREISMHSKRLFFIPHMQFTFHKEPSVSLLVGRALGEKLHAAAGHSAPPIH
jgi:hypothetical protein